MRNLEKVYDIVNTINDTITENVKARMTRGRLTFMALKNEEIDLEPFDIRYPDERVWSRGDGVRYKDPGYIRVMEGHMRAQHRKYSSFRTLHPNEQALLNHFWETLKQTPRAKELGTLSGSFRSDEYAPALRAGGLLWVRRHWGIEFGSMSRLNSGVWNFKPAEEKEIE